MRRNRLRAPLLLLAWTLVGCGGGEPTTTVATGPESEPAAVEASSSEPELSVYVVNYPLAYLAARLTGDWARVVFPAPREIDPAYWNPEPDQILAYQQADLILLNGADYAKWITRASLPASKLVNTSLAFQEDWIPLAEGPVHSHGPEGEHTHKGYAFAVWLDPQLAVAQAEAIAEALVEKVPEREGEIRGSLAAIVSDWQKLDQDLAASAESMGDRPLLFSHPVYQYLERRFSLNGRSVHWEPDQMPSEEQWQEVESLLERQPVEWMIWESSPLPEVEQRLLDRGVRSLVFDPCAGIPAAGDLLSVMRSNAARLRQISAGE